MQTPSKHRLRGRLFSSLNASVCPHRPHPRRPHFRANPSPANAAVQNAFTVVELLVVVGLIAILAAILIPTLARAKSAGKSSVCVNNLRQWGLATVLYAEENDDFLPPDGSPNGSSTKTGWYIDLPKTIKIATYPELPWRTNASLSPDTSIWVCPNSTNKSNGNNLFFYCLNENVNGTGAGNRPVMIDSIRRPSRTIWLFDNGRRAAVARQNNVAVKVHGNGANFLFLDGHVARFSAADYWDPKADRGLTNHPDLLWIP